MNGAFYVSFQALGPRAAVRAAFVNHVATDPDNLLLADVAPVVLDAIDRNPDYAAIRLLVDGGQSQAQDEATGSWIGEPFARTFNVKVEGLYGLVGV